MCSAKCTTSITLLVIELFVSCFFFLLLFQHGWRVGALKSFQQLVNSPAGYPADSNFIKTEFSSRWKREFARRHIGFRFYARNRFQPIVITVNYTIVFHFVRVLNEQGCPRSRPREYIIKYSQRVFFCFLFFLFSRALNRKFIYSLRNYYAVL